MSVSSSFYKSILNALLCKGFIHLRIDETYSECQTWRHNDFVARRRQMVLMPYKTRLIIYIIHFVFANFLSQMLTLKWTILSFTSNYLLKENTNLMKQRYRVLHVALDCRWILPTPSANLIQLKFLFIVWLCAYSDSFSCFLTMNNTAHICI